MVKKAISKSTLCRLPVYLEYLKSLHKATSNTISATTIATALKLGEVQVRKDLASVSSSGKPRIGYIVSYLIDELESFLGYKEANDAVIIGAGKLGKALLDYSGFKSYGINIVAAFDIDESLVSRTETCKPIFALHKFEDLCKRLKIKIGIITVPAKSAQIVCDLMIKNDILAIWNFAPMRLDVPAGILVQNENMASSLALLSNHLTARLNDN